ncbi:MAG: hypothetical protein AB7D43_03050 [Sulfurimonadaceae bacterium]
MIDEAVTFGKLIEYGGYLGGAYTLGFATCKGLDYFFKLKPVTTAKLTCAVPVLFIGALAQHKEISKTFYNHNGKVVNVSCYYKGAKNVCVLTKRKCKEY